MAHTKKTGFTLVEIIVVVAVISILLTLSVFGVNKYLTEGRDAHRLADINVIAEKLEKYFDKNGEYPACASLQGSITAITGGSLGIQGDALVSPTSQTPTVSSVICTALTPTTDSYAYVGTDCNSQRCAKWQLQYYQESTKSIATIDSRRSFTVVYDPFEIELSGTSFTYNEIVTICSSTANAPSGYTVVTPLSGSPYSGTSANEIIYRTSALGTTLGNGGNDILCIGTSSASVAGGSGDDIIYVQSTSGSISGDDGSDSIISVNSAGSVAGGNNDDVLYVKDAGGSVDGGGGVDKARITGTVSGTILSIEENF